MRQLALAGKQPLSMVSGDTGAVLLRLIYASAEPELAGIDDYVCLDTAAEV